jgi:penicillin-binding protein 2
MYRSIVQSCDTYYYMLANDMGVDTIHEQMQRFGFGELTGIDIFGEVRGLLPSTEWKRKAYKRADQQKWYAGETISLGIGQGYNNFTMLQLASATATLANNGVKMEPHLVKEVIDVLTHAPTSTTRESMGTAIAKPENIAIIKAAMVGVNIEGTSASSFRGASYTSAGKTGTAQVVQIKQNEKYVASKMEERFRDHALFMAFAPAENPKIALAVIVENAGFGAQNSAPIARRVFDFWLLNQYPNAQDIVAVQKAQATTPMGKPLTVAEVPWPPGAPVAAPAEPAASAAKKTASSAPLPPVAPH